MNTKLEQVLSNKILALADDEFILGHRNSEWCGHAPILEEDIAFANIAQDELGHANIWYGLYCDLTADAPDRLVFFRDAAGYRNVQMVELPKGDWAFSMLRQYLFDAAEMARVPYFLESQYRPLANAAAKIRPEELYHYRHTHTWVKRLGMGTDESNRRMQNALNELWPCAFQLFEPLPGEDLLVEAGLVPEPAELRSSWENVVVPFLEESGLKVPKKQIIRATQRDQHTQYLEELLAEMQQVARAYPGAQW